MNMSNKLFLYIFIAAIFLEFSPLVHAQQNSKSPVQVEADNTLEWDRENNRYIAKGNAIAKQDNMSLQGDMLIADYRKGKDNKDSMEIYKITANNNVVLTSADQQAFGDNLIYDMDTGSAILTGKNLYIVTPTDKITAQDRIEYHEKDQRLLAIGNAVATRDNQVLQGDIITAYFIEDDKGDTAIKRIEADGNVSISTDQEVITGKYGIYKPQSNMAEVRGDVVIKRGDNIVQGMRAITNLTTQISTVYAGKDSSGNKKRVTGTFIPGGFSKEK